MPFRLSPGLAAACLEHLGVDAPRDLPGAALLLDRLAATLPTGSTAKNEAVEAGRVPPGDDVATVAETWLARPELGWSCWAAATLYSALVAAGGVLTADVLGARRIDPATVPVDVHSVVELADGSQRWLADPFFSVAPVAAPAGEALRPGCWGQAVRDDAGVWRTTVGACASRVMLRYRTFTLPLTRHDVEGFCRISVTHTGVSTRPRVHLTMADGLVAATRDRDGVVRLRRWRAAPGTAWGARCETVEMQAWADAERAIAELAADAARTSRPADAGRT